MDTRELWQRYEDWLYYHDGLDLYLDVSRMRFDDSLIDTLKPKFAKAFKDMEALEGGAIANPDENRMVGHYWLRDPDRAPSQLRKEIIDTLNEIEAFVQKVHDDELFFQDMSDTIIQNDTFQLLQSFPNVVITAHQAFLTRNALEGIADTTLSNITDFERGQPLKNEVTYGGSEK